MKPASILNDVIGPVMRGPSSSHTAGPFFIGSISRDILGDEPVSAAVAFDPGGSFAEVYRQQGSDLGFVAGLLGMTITDDLFPRAIETARERGVSVRFLIEPLKGTTHPNTVEIRLTSRQGRTANIRAESVGGGCIRITHVNGRPTDFTGDSDEVLVGTKPGVVERHKVRPIFFPVVGKPLFSSAAEMIEHARARNVTLGQLALDYESALLGKSRAEVTDELGQRLAIMRKSVTAGLRDDLPPMHLLKPSAAEIAGADAGGRLPTGGIHTRAASRALAVMHVNSGGGVICAAPTAGSAGVIPGVLVSLMDEKQLGAEDAVRALAAAGAIGLIVSNRASFAAEVCGCQVEVGASCAMAAAAVVEASGGTAMQAANAAAIVFQNSLGMTCDPVGGLVEIPCQVRNAIAASTALTCADLVMGGYSNPVPLDETIEAVARVGHMLPRELKCTALGGLAATPYAASCRSCSS